MKKTLCEACELWNCDPQGRIMENKSPQQSWPIFMLECFQRQQSLFSYAINCLNRLPVEFLMCYKFHVCFPRVDSAQAYCVRLCPVISAGLGRTSTKENPSVLSSLQLNGILCASLSFISLLPQWNLPLHLHGTPMAFCNVRFLCVPFSYSRSRCETWRGSLSKNGNAKQIILQHMEELDSIEGTSLPFCLLKVQNQSTLRGFYL